MRKGFIEGSEQHKLLLFDRISIPFIQHPSYGFRHFLPSDGFRDKAMENVWK
jgi:hypothetical protein